MTTNQEPQSNHPISNLTVIELETLITKIVKKVMREEISRTKVREERVQYNPRAVETRNLPAVHSVNASLHLGNFLQFI